MLLVSNHRRVGRIAVPKAGDGAYRAVGSVTQIGGRWLACGRDGEVISEHRTRREAWEVADKLGYEKISGLEGASAKV